MLRRYGNAQSVIMILGGHRGPVFVGRCRPKRKNIGNTGNMPSATVVLDSIKATGMNGILAMTLKLGLPLTLFIPSNRAASTSPMRICTLATP